MTTTIDPEDPAQFFAGYDCGEAVGELRGEVRGWRAGYVKGLEDGRAEALAEVEAEESARIDAANRAFVARHASRPAYDELADRRGQRDRAEAQRRILRERGIS